MKKFRKKTNSNNAVVSAKGSFLKIASFAIVIAKKKILLTALLCVVGFTACLENDNNIPIKDNPTLQEENSLVGKWKLIELSIVINGNIEIIDCSNDNVIYNFQENGKLIVSNFKSFDLYGDILESGEYFYKYSKPITGSLVLPGPNLLIDNKPIDLHSESEYIGKQFFCGNLIEPYITDSLSITFTGWNKLFVRVKEAI